MPRKYTFNPWQHGDGDRRQWGFLNEELDNLYDKVVRGAALPIEQVNTFSVGDVVGISGGSWVLAEASVTACIGVVASATSSEFAVVVSGPMTWSSHGLTVGTKYYLSTTAGDLTATVPGPGDDTQLVLVPVTTDIVVVQIMEMLA